MKPWTLALIGSAVLLLGAAAGRKAHESEGNGGPPTAASALVGGDVVCFENGEQADLALNVSAGGAPVTGGVVGIPGGPFGTSGSRPGTCADALSALAAGGASLPAPLCATGPHPIRQGFTFACSGRARDVIEAVGDLAKAVIALP